jgi:hypothetical protein
MSSNQPTIPAAHPRVRTQLGILFGFVGIFIVVIVTFGVMWALYNKKQEKRELARKERLIEEGWGVSDIGEKGKGRDGDMGIDGEGEKVDDRERQRGELSEGRG